ncbi:MAG: DNA polymerase III subunit delta [Candidatus Methylacidiphilales bacterium]
MAETTDKHVFITGSDDHEVKRRSKEQVQSHLPSDPMNLEEIDGTAESVEAALVFVKRVREALLTLPFFGGTKVVYAKNVTVLQDTVIGRSEAVKEALAALLEVIRSTQPSEAFLIMAAPGADRRKAFTKALEKMTRHEHVDLPDIRTERGEAAWVAEVSRRLKVAGLKCEDGVAGLLVECVGNQTRMLESEIEKLCLFAHPSSEVTMESFRRIASSNRSMVVWDLCDAVVSGQVSVAVPLLRQLLAQGEGEVGILILLSNHIRMTALAVWLKEKKWLKVGGSGSFVKAELHPRGEALLPVSKTGSRPAPYQLARAVTAAGQRGSERWFQAVDICFQAHLKLLSGGLERDKFLESTVLTLCRI